MKESTGNKCSASISCCIVGVLLPRQQGAWAPVRALLGSFGLILSAGLQGLG
jgi:hypothetical protein